MTLLSMVRLLSAICEAESNQTSSELLSALSLQLVYEMYKPCLLLLSSGTRPAFWFGRQRQWQWQWRWTLQRTIRYFRLSTLLCHTHISILTVYPLSLALYVQNKPYSRFIPLRVQNDQITVCYI